MPSPLIGHKLKTGDYTPETMQKLLARNRPELLAFFTDLYQGKTFEEVGVTYTVTRVFCDDLKRIIAEGKRKHT